MNYFFQVRFRNKQRMIFSNEEYLCEETTKRDLLYLALPSLFRIRKSYRKWYSRFTLYVNETVFLYELTKENLTLAPDLDSKITGKYRLTIYATKKKNII